jgi:hypothetical protein
MNEDLKEQIRQSLNMADRPQPREFDMAKELEAIQYIGNMITGGGYADHGTFRIDQDNRPGIENLITYFNSTPEKGIMLRGGIGSGKTLIMTIFQKYAGMVIQRNGFKMYHVRDIIIAFNAEGAKGVDQFILTSTVECGTPTKKAVRICVDDIGTEENSYKFYGSQANVIEELIYGRYQVWQSRGVPFHIITNLTPADMNKFYGERSYSRLVEMMEDIVIGGGDRRRK